MTNPNPNPSKDELISAEEAMQLLGIKKSKLYQLINAGTIQRANESPIRQRQQLVFWRSEILALLEKASAKNSTV
jgi:predicted DNA-binding transcriptional regulator AlpA